MHRSTQGVTFVTSAHVGRNVDIKDLLAGADAIVLAAGATKPRDLAVEGRCAHCCGVACIHACLMACVVACYQPDHAVKRKTNTQQHVKTRVHSQSGTCVECILRWNF